MKYRSTLKMCIYLLFLIAFSSKQVSFAGEDNDLFHHILSVTKSQVVEYGLKASIETEEAKEEDCNDILKRLGINNNDYEISTIRNEQSYYIEFKSQEVSGYVEYINDHNDKKINIEVLKNGHNLELDDFEHNLKSVIVSKDSIKLYRYVKAKTDMADTKDVKELVVRTLEENGAKNIDSISLGESISITALTGAYERINNGGTWIDFNSAVCSYDSGNYLIIGTPIIMKSY